MYMCVSNFHKNFNYQKFPALNEIIRDQIAEMNHYFFPYPVVSEININMEEIFSPGFPV